MGFRRCAAALFPLLILLLGCLGASPAAPYGVFIGAEAEDLRRLPDCRTIVIDAAYFSKEDISFLHQKGSKVYSYLNIGSIETFREVYPQFREMALDPYENWPDEFWMDVSRPQWRQYLVETAAQSLTDKGVDGFFLDNADVYYQYPTPEIFEGLVEIVAALGRYGKEIIINGGDVFVSEAVLKAENPLEAVTGVNQECVFTAIDFEAGALSRQQAEDSGYYLDYLAQCRESALDVYLLEYAPANQSELRREISDYCAKQGYTCYVASSIELDSAPQ